MPKNFVGEPFSVSLVSGIEKFYASEGYVTIFCRKFFCLTVLKKFVEEPFCAVFQKFSLAKMFMDRRRKGVSKISMERFWSHSAEKIVRGTLLCCVSESFWQRKSLWTRRGGIKIFCRFFMSHVPNICVGEPFSVSLISGIEKC